MSRYGNKPTQWARSTHVFASCSALTNMTCFKAKRDLCKWFSALHVIFVHEWFSSGDRTKYFVLNFADLTKIPKFRDLEIIWFTYLTYLEGGDPQFFSRLYDCKLYAFFNLIKWTRTKGYPSCKRRLAEFFHWQAYIDHVWLSYIHYYLHLIIGMYTSLKSNVRLWFLC